MTEIKVNIRNLAGVLGIEALYAQWRLGRATSPSATDEALVLLDAGLINEDQVEDAADLLYESGVDGQTVSTRVAYTIDRLAPK